MIKFETYDKSKLDAQIELITEVTKDWSSWNYPDKAGLERAYSQENFTPETRHYAYKADKLVAFVSSAVEEETDGVQWGSIQVPFVLKEFPQVEDELMKKAISTLKSKGVHNIRTLLPEGWIVIERFCKAYGYDDGTLAFELASFTVDFINFPADYKRAEHVREFDTDLDKDALVEAFSTEMTQTKEQITAIIDNWKERENILANAIVREGDDIFSHSMAIKVIVPEGNDFVFMTGISIYKEGKEELLPDVFLYLMEVIKETGINEVRHGVVSNLKEYYEPYNLEFIATKRYVLDLTK
ncbi:MAG: hypothetical protein KAR35_01420 [Candidatus Heimdallarchaeota archaeon]|nr:hypothetical protein [Candidatus Heimdallarchaeota archaeon]MCK5048015.1 hypothetical protein [Candidatus Heimdallarchaeota archaeon]